MSSYYELYQKRLTIRGNNVQEVRIDNAKRFIEDKFTSSPSYQQLDINGVLTDCQVITTNKDNEREIIFKPDIVKNVGEVVSFLGDKWLIVEFIEHDVFPKCKIKRCNQTLTLQTGTTKIQTGTDSMGRPIYSEEPTYTSFNCIANNKIQAANLDEPINLPQGTITVTIPYTDITIKENMEFTMWNEDFKIVGIDKTNTINSTGIFIITAQKVVS